MTVESKGGEGVIEGVFKRGLCPLFTLKGRRVGKDKIGGWG